MRVKCRHKRPTQKFLCNCPDTGKKLAIQLHKNAPVRIDVRIAELYPDTFTIIEAPKAPAAKPAAKKVVDMPKVADEIIVEPAASEWMSLEDAETEVYEIMSIGTKKKLVAYADEKGVEIDSTLKLKEMKVQWLCQ